MDDEDEDTDDGGNTLADIQSEDDDTLWYIPGWYCLAHEYPADTIPIRYHTP